MARSLTMDYNSYNMVKKFEQKCKDHGFEITRYKWGNQNDGTCYIQLVPTEDNYPVYSRDAQLASGSIEYLMAFMDGMEFMKNYYQMLKLVDDKKVSRKEQDERNRVLMRQMGE